MKSLDNLTQEAGDTVLRNGETLFSMLENLKAEIEALELRAKRAEGISDTVERLLKENKKLQIELTHPTIDVSYYEWLEIAKQDEYGKELIEKCGWLGFHSTAMWAWQNSRTALRKKVEPDHLKILREDYQKQVAATQEEIRDSSKMSGADLSIQVR